MSMALICTFVVVRHKRRCNQCLWVRLKQINKQDTIIKELSLRQLFNKALTIPQSLCD